MFSLHYRKTNVSLVLLAWLQSAFTAMVAIISAGLMYRAFNRPFVVPIFALACWLIVASIAVYWYVYIKGIYR